MAEGVVNPDGVVAGPTGVTVKLGIFPTDTRTKNKEARNQPTSCQHFAISRLPFLPDLRLTRTSELSRLRHSTGSYTIKTDHFTLNSKLTLTLRRHVKS
jgi:hypothetical protein